MTVYDFYNLLTDNCEINIYDLTKEETIFSGWTDEIPEEIAEMEVFSIDSPDGSEMFTINIDTEL